MNILIPMAGAGSRFTNQGYSEHKPLIPVTSRHSLITLPMVVAAVRDLPVDIDSIETNLLFILRDFHLNDGVDKALLVHFPRAQFIAIEALTEGQASTCLHARAHFDMEAPMMIAACDNGMDLSCAVFQERAKEAEALIFTFCGNDAATENPNAYGWVRTEGEVATGVSIKQPISSTPHADHAIVGAFWFQNGHDFFAAADQMIASNERINGEFYVDQVFRHLIDSGKKVHVSEVDRYICWGTPEEYEAYEGTLTYWTNFVSKEEWLR